MKITLRIPAIAIEIEAAGVDIAPTAVPTPTPPTPDRPTAPTASAASPTAANVPDPLAAPSDPLTALGIASGGPADPKPLSEADVRSAIGAALRRGAERNAITACIQGQGASVVAELRPDQYLAVITAINNLNR